MQFFINTGDVEIVRRYAEMQVIDGVTTNPSLVAAQSKDFRELITELSELVGMVFAQVTSRNAAQMVEQALEISSYSPRVVVKIPSVPEGFKAMGELRKRKIAYTATLVYTPTQAVLAARLGAKYVASFVKRQDSIASSGIEVIEKIVRILRGNQFETKVQAAGMSSHLEIVQTLLAGVDCITMDPPFFEEIMTHPMSAIGENNFLADWEKYVAARRQSAGVVPGWMSVLA